MKWRVVHLARWQRFGIVVSILAFLGCFFYLWDSAVNSSNSDVAYFANTCELLRFDSKHACLVRARHFAFRPSWGLAMLDIIISATLIGFAWCAAWAGRQVFKWMLAAPEDETIT
jgi:hypothetical protein